MSQGPRSRLCGDLRGEAGAAHRHVDAARAPERARAPRIDRNAFVKRCPSGEAKRSPTRGYATPPSF